MKSNIILVGMMGSGKSFSSKRLGELLKMPFVSTDALIEEKEGQPIAEIFAKKGEAYFRNLEKEIVKDVSQKENIIIDCGGGVVLDPENITNLKKNGTMIYLAAPAEFLYEKIKNATHRPLLKGPDPLGKIKELLITRDPLYRKADVTLDTNNLTIEEICQQIRKVLGHGA